MQLTFGHLCLSGVVRCGPKNGHQSEIMCLKEIGLCAQKLFSVPRSMINIIGETHMLFQKRDLHFDIE